MQNHITNTYIFKYIGSVSKIKNAHREIYNELLKLVAPCRPNTIIMLLRVCFQNGFDRRFHTSVLRNVL